MEEIELMWEKVLSKIEMMVSAVSFDLWIKPIEILELKDYETLVLEASSTMAKNQLLKNHMNQLKECVEQVFGDNVEIKILDKKEGEEYLKASGIKEEDLSTAVKEKNPFNEKYTFDNFVVGKSNQFVYAACRSVAEHPGSQWNPLFIYGGVGLGKTHLLHAIGNYIKQYTPHLKIMYVTCENFTNDYIDSLRSGNKDKSISSFREKYRNVDVLMVDDIQFITNKTETQEEFFHTFNDLYQNNKQIIIASDRSPKDIATLSDRLSSRFSSGLIQDIQAPDFETRIAILRKKAAQERYFIDDDVIEFIAEKVDTNIREMEGLLSKVFFFAQLLGKKSASLEDARETFKEQLDDKKERLTPDAIINAVCDYFSISTEEIKGKKKSKEIVEPRMMAIYLINELLGLPLVTIGKIFGRDHTTIIHARDKITEMQRTDNKTRTILNDLNAKISNVWNCG